MNPTLPQPAAALTMSSREIADLIGKRHDNVMRDIRDMLDRLGIAALKFEGSYLGADGTQRPCFLLPKRETLILVSGYSVPMRARIIDRWLELEAQAAADAVAAAPPAAPLPEGEMLPALARLVLQGDHRTLRDWAVTVLGLPPASRQALARAGRQTLLREAGLNPDRAAAAARALRELEQVLDRPLPGTDLTLAQLIAAALAAGQPEAGPGPLEALRALERAGMTVLVDVSAAGDGSVLAKPMHLPRPQLANRRAGAFVAFATGPQSPWGDGLGWAALPGTFKTAEPVRIGARTYRPALVPLALCAPASVN